MGTHWKCETLIQAVETFLLKLYFSQALYTDLLIAIIMFDLKLVVFLVFIGFLHAQPKHGDAVRKQVFRKAIEDPRNLKSVTVIGSCKTSNDSFSNNFFPRNWKDGVPFHLAVRHDRDQDGRPKIILDSKKDVWLGADKFYPDNNAFDAGNKFTLKYEINEQQIKVYLNGENIKDYQFKQPFSVDDLKNFKVSGDINLESVCIRAVRKLECYGDDLPE